jgi:hypothetical protein
MNNTNIATVRTFEVRVKLVPTYCIVLKFGVIIIFEKYTTSVKVII